MELTERNNNCSIRANEAVGQLMMIVVAIGAPAEGFPRVRGFGPARGECENHDGLCNAI